jgi:glucokinase
MHRIINALTIDIGGTNVRVGAGKCNYNSKTAKVLAEPIIFKAPASQEELEQRIGESIVAIKNQCEQKLQMLAVCTAGIVDGHKSTLISLCNQPGWKNVNFESIASKYCPEIMTTDGYFPYPVYVENDAKAAALAQYYFGKHQSKDNLIYLTCSTGMGAGIIQDGLPLLGGQRLAGEVGHMIVDTSQTAPTCGCGQRGCWEAHVGMKNFARNAGQWLDFLEYEEPWYLRAKNSERGLRSEDIFEAALKDNNPDAMYLVRNWVDFMAFGLGNIIVSFNPSMIVLGTVVQYWGEPLLSMIRQSLESRFRGMTEQIKHCRIIANGIKRLDVLAPLATGTRHHSLIYGWEVK